MKKRFKTILYVLFFVFPIISCTINEEEEIQKFPETTNQYDPSSPNRLDEIKPNYGVIDQTFIVNGNFEGDLSDMKVYFGEFEAVLTATNGKSITGLVPKQPDGEREVTVVTKTDSISPGLIFDYNQSRSIKTVAGVLGEDNWLDDDEYQNADINSVTFGEVHYVATVAGNNQDNVIMVETGWGNRVFFLNIVDQEVRMLSSPRNIGAPAVPSSRDKFYAVQMRGDGWDGPDRPVYVFDKEESWAALSTGIVIKNDDIGTKHGSSCTFAEDDNLLYYMDNDGRIAEINLEQNNYKIYTAEGKKPESMDENVFGGYIRGELPERFGGWQDSYITYSEYHECFFASFTGEDAIYKYVKNTDDTWTVELYAGRNGEGGQTGHRLADAQFHNPHGMVVNDRGQIFVCNRGHFINMIEEDAVEMIAGQYNTYSPLQNGEPEDAILDQPRNLAIDFEGNYYIAGGMDRTVRKLSIE
ncbi:MAG: IPT/TIG domain-containing protein [Bacteroidales bacterium]